MCMLIPIILRHMGRFQSLQHRTFLRAAHKCKIALRSTVSISPARMHALTLASLERDFRVLGVRSSG